MTNREIAQEISNRIGTAPVPFDSVYSIALQIYNELGGEQTQFDSVYSILLEILPLVEGGIKPIEEVSELPEASENKDKLFRLDNGEKDVYTAKLISSETITTNRLPDAQQIDKGYIYSEYDIYKYYGEYTVRCTNGDAIMYLWVNDYGNDEFAALLSIDNAVVVNSSSLVFPFVYDDYEPFVTIDKTNKIITIPDTIENVTPSYSLSDLGYIPIPATYNAPESAQIGNADVTDASEELDWLYDGTEVTITIDGEQFIGYKWLSEDASNDYFLSDKQASNIYFNKDSESNIIYSNIKWYRVRNNVATPDDIMYLYIPQLNASDSEQVGKAYIKYNYRVTSNYYYTGELATIGNFTGYKWEKTDKSNFIITVGVNAENLYVASGNSASKVKILDNSTGNEIYYGYANYYPVEYQRTETTEEWGWEKIATEEYVDDAIAEIPQLEAGENVEIADNKINAKGYKYIDNIQAFIENPYSYQRNISEYPLSMLGITELKLTGSANALTYTYSGSGSTAFEQMAGMIITNMGGGLKIESGNYAYLESIDTTNKTVTFKSTLDADNALSNAIVTAIVVKMDFFISGVSGAITYSYTDTSDLASSLEELIDSNLYMKFEGYPLVKVTAIDTENETITFNKTLNAETAISNVNFEYGRCDANVASGINSHVEGAGNECSGNFAHAEGNRTTASGMSSHAEGSYTTASGRQSHAEGNETTASGEGSHTEGQRTIASGYYSHAEGSDTKTSNMAEHAEGYNNISHNLDSQTSKQTMSSIGIGDSVNSRNGFEMMHNGDLYIYGVGGYDGVHIKHEQGYESTKTLQEYIASLEARIAALENPNA